MPDFYIQFSEEELAALKADVRVPAADKRYPYRYPFLLIHGYDNMTETMVGARDVIRAQGYEAYSPHVGPYTSSWDRACDLYAILLGGKADYGEAHSKKYNHARFGTREYPGLVPDWGNEDVAGNVKKINFIGHSFGGITARTFLNLLAEGSEAEREATPPEELSPLFAGGKESWVNSITTLATPHNGVTISALADPVIRAQRFTEFLQANLNSGTDNEKAGAYEMDMFGFSSGDKKLPPRPDRIMRFLTGQDNAFYELEPKGCAEVTKDYKTYPGVYYFSYRGVATVAGTGGIGQVPDSLMIERYRGVATTMGMYRSDEYGPEWQANDGRVNEYSARAPFGEEQCDYPGEAYVKPGVWNIMPAEHKYHSAYLGEEWPREEFIQFYSDLCRRIARLP